ncbi:MAG: ribosome maturation factor RimM [Chloroflexi bacterium]|nr:ribosome maturation factor RimM [Chloroflexota bacterium]
MTGSVDRSEFPTSGIRRQQNLDSPGPGFPNDEELVVVGRVRRPTGINGVLLVEVYSGNLDRFTPGDTVFVNGVERQIVETGKSGNSAKLKFKGIDSIEAAEVFRDVEIYVTATSLPENPPGVYYHYEILGCTVVTVDGQALGTLTEIIESGSNDVFVIKRSPDTQDPASAEKKPAKTSTEILIPVLDGVIISVDSSSHTMTIDPPEGLF